MIQLSPAATQEILRLRSCQTGNPRFRLRVQPGGCSDFYYSLSFDDQLYSTDQTWSCNGVEGVIDAHTLQLADGLLLDYSEDLMGGGFRFHNPQATQSCGCGHSFAIAADATPPVESCHSSL